MKNRILLGLLLLASSLGFAQSSGGGFTAFSKLRVTTNPTDNPFRGKLLVRDTVTGNIDKIQFSDLPLNFTLTTADSSGVATLSAGNLNIPNYGLNSVPLSGTEVGKPIMGPLSFTDVEGDISYLAYYNTDDGFEAVVGDADAIGLYNVTKAGVNIEAQETGNGLARYIFRRDYFSANEFSDKLNDPNAFAQLGDIATGFESGYTTTDQVITAITDTIITLSGASFESDGGLNLIDGTSGKITPLLQGDILSIDIAMPLLTPVGTNEYCTMTLVPFGTTNVYRAITHQFIKGAGNQDYISANWTVPIGADIITAGGLSIVINSTAGITIDSKYISVSRIHRTKN